MYMHPGRRIQHARRLVSLRASDLAELVDVHEVTVKRWECGQREVSPFYLRKVAEACNTTVSYLLGEEGYDEPFRVFTGQIPYRHTSKSGK